MQHARSLANQYFRDANYGVPGNSDAGALNSWLIWQMLGLCEYFMSSRHD